MRIDFFEKDGSKASKRWLLTTRQRVQGYWAPIDSRTLDLATGNETRLVAQTIKFDRKLPARLFTSRALSDESIEA